MINITKKQNCTGCYACYNICPKTCITMESDKEGFWYPKVDISGCIECGLCEKVCPNLNKKSINNEPQAYACINTDESIRLESSSGGVFTLISEYVIENNGVVFGAGFDEDFNVVHSFVETKDELKKFRSSKYVQSKIGNTYSKAKDFLNQGREVLFTGTPCQIAGLNSYLKKSYENLFCIDTVCHGVPSTKVWQKYISYQENCFGSQTNEIALRNKDHGWKQYSVSFLFDNNKEYIQTHNNDIYIHAYLKNVCLRPSCYECKNKTLHRQSDITFADFWGIQNILPEMDDDKGTSLIIVSSIKGHLMLEHIKDKMKCIEVDINQALKYNSAAIKSSISNRNREMFFKDLDTRPFNQLVKKYCSDNMLYKIKRKTKYIIKKYFKINIKL